MKKLISYWSIKTRGDGAEAVASAMDDVKASGLDGLELTVGESGPLTPNTDQRTCEGYRRAAADRGLVLETLASGMSWGCSPSHVDEAVRKHSISIHAAALQRAGWIGAKAMLFVPGAVMVPWDAKYPPVPYDDAVRWAKESIAQLAEVAERVGVDLCIENVWNGLFLSPLELAQVIDDAGSARVGVYFDVGNVLGYHQHPPHWIGILGARIKRVHIKDFKKSVGNLNGFCDLLEGDVPWSETMAALRKIGYDKTIVAEIGGKDLAGLRKTNEDMSRILAM